MCNEKAVFGTKWQVFPVVAISPTSCFSNSNCHFKFRRQVELFNVTTKGVRKLGLWSFFKKNNFPPKIYRLIEVN